MSIDHHQIPYMSHLLMGEGQLARAFPTDRDPEGLEPGTATPGRDAEGGADHSPGSPQAHPGGTARSFGSRRSVRHGFQDFLLTGLEQVSLPVQ
jgi:hypothetical protein